MQAKSDFDQYGKARGDVYESFVHVVSRRKEDTLKYIREYTDRLKADEAKRSIAAKAGGWVSNLIVWGAMAAIVGSVLYSHYLEANNP